MSSQENRWRITKHTHYQRREPTIAIENRVRTKETKLDMGETNL